MGSCWPFWRVFLWGASSPVAQYLLSKRHCVGVAGSLPAFVCRNPTVCLCSSLETAGTMGDLEGEKRQHPSGAFFPFWE